MTIFITKSHYLAKKSTETVNFCDKKSQPSDKKVSSMTICVMESHNLLKKSHEIVYLFDK